MFNLCVCYNYIIISYALRQSAHGNQEHLHLRLVHFTDVGITDTNFLNLILRKIWLFQLRIKMKIPSTLILACSFIWRRRSFFWDLNFCKHDERSEIGKRGEGGVEYLENLKGLVTIWTVFDDAQGNNQIFWLCIYCTVCLPSTIIAAFLRLKLETRQNIILQYIQKLI